MATFGIGMGWRGKKMCCLKWKKLPSSPRLMVSPAPCLPAVWVGVLSSAPSFQPIDTSSKAWLCFEMCACGDLGISWCSGKCGVLAWNRYGQELRADLPRQGVIASLAGNALLPGNKEGKGSCEEDAFVLPHSWITPQECGLQQGGCMAQDG